jgi:Rieske Fe-S protein
MKGDPTRRLHRRTFLKVLLGLGATLGLTPTVTIPLAERLVQAKVNQANKRQKVVVDDSPPEGAAAGKAVNVNDLSTFPPNSSWTITYPSSGDAGVDGKNPNTFEKFRLIRLPVELGGSDADASSFAALSVVCTHLWCSLDYNPTQGGNPGENGYRPNAPAHQDLECPCHANFYSVPDGVLTNVALLHEKPPATALPYLILSADSEGYLWIEPPIWDYAHNGVIGYGRYV